MFDPLRYIFALLGAWLFTVALLKPSHIERYLSKHINIFGLIILMFTNDKQPKFLSEIPYFSGVILVVTFYFNFLVMLQPSFFFLIIENILTPNFFFFL